MLWASHWLKAARFHQAAVQIEQEAPTKPTKNPHKPRQIRSLPFAKIPTLELKFKIEVQCCPDAGYLEIDRQTGSLTTGTQLIEAELGIPCAVLNGANVATDVAHDHFAEARRVAVLRRD